MRSDHNGVKGGAKLGQRVSMVRENDHLVYSNAIRMGREDGAVERSMP